ncbi:MAG: GH3 auxin-responsive promoter family protein [Deltaproteobacteria bacterium]|nr:GH3 auxin-responsive promoter family protein [Deltaproteobacteria bacterium]MBN2670411.1 GH3 auxin-responsive promoter family protein [Deltaproteobacteria bacterium]
MRKFAAAFMKMGIARNGKPMLNRLNAESTDVRLSQQRVLNDIIAYAANTVYGQTHKFQSIRTPAEFQSAVPVNQYESLRPYVERHEKGEPNVLFPGKPMFYATTSGTTAAPKRIPITRKYHDECYNGLSNLWLHTMFIQNPGFMNGYDISMVGKAIEGYTPDGTSFGSFSGHMNAYMPEFIKRFRVVPFEVHDIDHYPSKYYALLRVALMYPIRWIVAANPSTLLELHRFVMERYDDIVRDIADGTLRSDLNIDVPIRRAIEQRLSTNKKRAWQLTALQTAFGDALRPKHYWPGLQVINTWKSGNAGLYLKQTEGFFPDDAVIREFGYLATEARAGIVLGNNDETSILAAHLLYFEFVERDEKDSKHQTFLQAHELEAGKEYGIFITTPSGLYRYDMNDIVRVEGFYNQFPRIRFVQKGTGATSLTGEKLYEAQYLDAMTDTLAKMNLTSAFHVAFAELESSSYQSFVELSPSPPPPKKQHILDAMSLELDEQLQKRNPEYAAKRKSNRLRPPVLHSLQPGAFVKYKSLKLAQGAREGQFKMTHLQQDDAQLALFRSLCNDAYLVSGGTI